MSTIDERVDALDLSLFENIPSQTNEGDRTSLLTVQRELRKKGGYVYLEIGSHLGGTIQPHYADPRCKRIYSIDKRPLSQPDNRGFSFDYPENSTQTMIQNLRAAFPDADHDKLVTFDCDASDVPADAIAELPDLCFIDGEHTYDAVLSDYRFCMQLAGQHALVLLHDAWVTLDAILHIKEQLKQQGYIDPGAKLMGSVYAFLPGEDSRDLRSKLDALVVDEKAYIKKAVLYLDRQKKRAHLGKFGPALPVYDFIMKILDRIYVCLFEKNRPR